MPRTHNIVKKKYAAINPSGFRKCGICQTLSRNNDNFCPCCGYQFAEVCPDCKSPKNYSNAKFCVHCGIDFFKNKK